MHKHTDTILHLPSVSLSLNPKHAIIKLSDTSRVSSFVAGERVKTALCPEFQCIKIINKYRITERGLLSKAKFQNK